MKGDNVLDGDLATNKKRNLAILERNRMEVMRKLRIPRFALFFWSIGYLTMGYLAVGAYALIFGLIFLCCGLFMMKYPLVSTITSVIIGADIMFHIIYSNTETFSLEPRDFVPILIYLILCVGVVNAFRLRKIEREIRELSS